MQLFCDSKREEIKVANPAAGFGETGKLLAAAWKECSPEEKSRLQEQSQVRSLTACPLLCTKSLISGLEVTLDYSVSRGSCMLCVTCDNKQHSTLNKKCIVHSKLWTLDRHPDHAKQILGNTCRRPRFSHCSTLPAASFVYYPAILPAF